MSSFDVAQQRLPMRILSARSCFAARQHLPELCCTTASPYRSAQHTQPAARHHARDKPKGISVTASSLLPAQSLPLGCNTTFRDPAVVPFLPNLPLNLKAVLGENTAFHQHLRSTKEKQNKAHHNRDASRQRQTPFSFCHWSYTMSHSAMELRGCRDRP